MFNKELIDKIETQSKEIEKLKIEKNNMEKKFDNLFNNLEEEIPKIRLICIDTREKVQLLHEHLSRIADILDTRPKISPPLNTPLHPVIKRKMPLPRGETIYSDDQSRIINKNLWENFEKNFLDGNLHTIQEGKSLIKPYYKEEASDKYIVVIYNEYNWYAINKRNFIKKTEISNGTFFYSFKHDKKRKTDIRVKNSDIFENSITKKVIKKYAYNFDKESIKIVEQALNNQTILIWNSVDFKKFIKGVLSPHFKYVADGRAYAHIEYFKESGLLNLHNGLYRIMKSKEHTT